MKNLKLICISFFLVFTDFFNAAATTVAPVTLERMTLAAGRIVVGRCVGVSTGTQRVGPNLTVGYFEYRFEVTRTLKGAPVSSLRFRHMGDFRRGNVLGSSMLPVYSTGREYVLFLTPESDLGLCSPVGLTQGAFQVLRLADGRTAAVNGVNNAGLAKPERPLAEALGRPLTRDEAAFENRKSGPLDLDVLIRMTETMLVKTKGGRGK